MALRLDLVELQPQQLSTLLSDALDALIVTDPDGNVLFMNAAAQDLYGFGRLQASEQERVNLQRYSREAFEFSSIDGVGVAEEEQPLTRALHGEPYKDVELRVRHRQSDEERIFTFSGTRLDGNPPLGVLTIRDITELRKAERRYRISFETNPAPTLIAQLADATLVDVNDGFTEMTGVPKAEAVGQPLVGLGLLPVADDLRRVLDGLAEGRMVHHQQTTIRRRGAGEREVLVSARPIEIEGEACGIFTFVDITELRAAQRRAEQRSAELRDANAELDAFNYSVSHDLRAPLRAINGFSQAVLEDFGDRLNGRGRAYLERVKSGAERMGELIDALLTLSRLTRGELKIDTVDLSGVAREVAAALQEEAPARRVEFEVAGGLLARGDARMLRVVVRNLLENAWKFTRHAEVARIEVGGGELEGEEAVFFVRDNGAGFDSRYVERLFVPFQRLHNSEEFEGHGIGLAMTQRIIHRHGGRIWAEGNVGAGATFYFTLPAEGST